MLNGNETDCPRAGHQCDFAQVDAAADDDKPHSQSQDTENGYAPDKSENVLRCRKAGQGRCKNDQKQNGDHTDTCSWLSLFNRCQGDNLLGAAVVIVAI